MGKFNCNYSIFNGYIDMSLTNVLHDRHGNLNPKTIKERLN